LHLQTLVNARNFSFGVFAKLFCSDGKRLETKIILRATFAVLYANILSLPGVLFFYELIGMTREQSQYTTNILA